MTLNFLDDYFPNTLYRGFSWKNYTVLCKIELSLNFGVFQVIKRRQTTPN